MKIMIGAILVLVLGLAGVGWQLKESWAREGTLAEQLSGVRGALEQSEKQNGTLAGRFDTLDQTLVGLGLSQKKNQAELTTRLAAIKSIVQEPEDDPASVACLDVRVPAQLDRGLR